MSTRLSTGGRLIDRGKPLSFTFNGKQMKGFAGDSLAAALLANDQLVMGRSFKYHRPRGVVASGAEEPNALVGLGEGARFEPNQRATTTELFEGLTASSQKPLALAGVRRGRRQRGPLALLPRGLLLQDLHGPPRGLEAPLRAGDPQVRGPRQADQPGRPRQLRALPRPRRPGDRRRRHCRAAGCADRRTLGQEDPAGRAGGPLGRPRPGGRGGDRGQARRRVGEGRRRNPREGRECHATHPLHGLRRL